jgi:hypothetical protein
MSSTILFVFEGREREPKIFESMKQHFFNDKDRHLTATFNNNIYNLYQEIQDYKNKVKGANVDIVTILKEVSEKNKKDNKNNKHNQLSEIESIEDIDRVYLFFDYDGHDTNASDDKVKEMLEHFNEETENGKLYISYPMVEAIKHLKSDVNFQNTIVHVKPNITYKKYKTLVNANCDRCYTYTLQLEHWKTIAQEHCKKLNFLMTDFFSFPEKIFDQLEIFEVQQEKYINPTNQVAVLSAFPVLLLDYYGAKGLYNKISPQLAAPQESI